MIANIISSSIPERKKTVLKIVISIISIIAIILLSSWFIVLKGFVELEEKFVENNVFRSQEIILDRINNLKNQLSDWSNWDDLYTYVEDKNEDFQKGNLIDQACDNLKINFIIIVNNKKEIVNSLGYDLANNKKLDLPNDLIKYSTGGGVLVNHKFETSSITGILIINNAPLLIVSQPILTSSCTGPMHGTLIFGRYLDSPLLNNFSEILHLNLDIQKFEYKSLDEDFKKIFKLFIIGKEIIVKPFGKNFIAGYSILKDVFDKPVLILRVKIKRDIYNQGVQTIIYYIAFILIFGFICSFIIYLPFKKELELKNEIQKKLIELNKKTEDANKSKSQFLANMSHEIRNPMNTIVGFSTLLTKTRIDEKQKIFVDSINESSQMLLSLINDILDISKIEAGELKLESIDFNINEVLESVITINSIKLNEKNLVLKSYVDDSLPKNLVGDPTRIKQILINFVSNAIKFTEKGEIFINIESLGKVSDSDSKSLIVKFSVKDSGIGIPEDKKELLFKAFEQLDISTTRKYGGSGLGLAISKVLVELMGGKILVKSEFGKGTEFSFTINLLQSDFTHNKSDKRLKGVISESSCKGIKVLLAEDNPSNQRAMDIILKKLGCIVDTASDGNEVIEKMTLNMYDLILMDVQMPEMNGFDASLVIRQKISKTIPIIALTGAATIEDKEKCRLSGMNDFLVKPIDLNFLVEKIVEWGVKKGINDAS